MQDKFKHTLNKVNKAIDKLRVDERYGKIHKCINVCWKSYHEFCQWIVDKLYNRGISANIVSLLGFLLGLLAINFISLESYGYGLLFIFVNRFFDSLDGALARKSKVTEYGLFMDTVLDYVFYAGVIFAFALANPEQNAVAASFLLFSFTSAACAMLSYAVVDYKKQIHELDKSPFYLGGLAQGAETFVALVLMCLVPTWFLPLAILFGVLSFVKALSIVIAAYYQLVITPRKKEK